MKLDIPDSLAYRIETLLEREFRDSQKQSQESRERADQYPDNRRFRESILFWAEALTQDAERLTIYRKAMSCARTRGGKR